MSVLKNFIEENFCFDSLLKVGLFSEEMRNDYKSQSDKICNYFGYKTIYEYGSKEIRCHISYTEDKPLMFVNEVGALKEEPFITVIKSVYES